MFRSIVFMLETVLAIMNHAMLGNRWSGIGVELIEVIDLLGISERLARKFIIDAS